MDAAKIEARLHEMSRDELVTLITQANAEYWDEHAPTLPDPLYDRLVERLRKLDPDAPILSSMGPSTPSGPTVDADDAVRVPPEERFGTAVRHARPMLSLDKAYSAQEVESWAEKFEGDMIVMPKLDGIACSIRYDHTGALVLAATRGSGTEGEDVTANVLEIAGVPAQLPEGHGPVEVRGEIHMTLSVFERFKEDFSNPRNLAAGAMRNKDRAKSRAFGLSFGAYDILEDGLRSEREKIERMKELGLPACDHVFVDREGIAGAFERFSTLRPTLDYEIDGVVYRADRVDEHERLGSTAHHPRFAIAFKFQGDTGETTLEDVEWGVSRTGTITPMAILTPIELSGAMISRAGLHNLTQFKALALTRGARVEVTRRGGVIPHVEQVLEAGLGGAFDIPTKCPACDCAAKIRQKRDGEFLQCARPAQCSVARLRELEHFAKVVDIQGFGPKIVNAVADAGLLAEPADYYRLALADLVKLERLAEKSAQNLLDQIAAHRTIELPVFLESLGIDHLGPQNAKLLAVNFLSLAKIRALDQETLCEIKGVKEAIADAIIDGLAARSAMIDDLLKEVTVPDQEAAPEPAEGAEAGPLDGKSFLFTGTLEGFDRKSAQQRVQALGGQTPSGVSRGLSVLVVGAGKTSAKSSKQKKAEKLNGDGATIEIITEAQFVAMMEQAEGGQGA